MKTKTNSYLTLILRSVVMTIMTAWACGAYAVYGNLTQQPSPRLLALAAEGTVGTEYKEKTLYSTDFTDWKPANSSTTETQVTKVTTDDQTLVFSLMETEVKPDGTNTKFTKECITKGYLMAAKTATPYIKTSVLKSVTKVKFVHAATGSSRGWGLMVKGEGDSEWEIVSNAVANPSDGQEVTVNVNRTNVQLWFYNLNEKQNAYMTSLEIMGNVEVVPRTFTDFKVDFRTNANDPYYTVFLPEDGSLPEGVQITNVQFNDNRHGAKSATITVPVDGPVKFTIGACQYGNHKVTVDDKAGISTVIDNNTGACDNSASDLSSAKYEQYVTWTYNKEEEDVLTFTLNGYLPYFFAEQCEYIPMVTVTYYDTDGTTVLGSKTVDAGTALTYAYENNVTVPEGCKFRGWYGSSGDNAEKIPEGKTLVADLDLYAKATLIETPVPGKTFVCDFKNKFWYPEDHDFVTLSNDASYHSGTHGWSFKSGGTIAVEVAGDARLSLSTCQYSNPGTITVTDANGNVVGDAINIKPDVDGGLATVSYKGPATTLTLTLSNGGYIHNLKVENLMPEPVVISLDRAAREVTITNTTNHTAYYTIDGTDPSADNNAGTLALGSRVVKIDDNAWVKVRYVQDDGSLSDVIEKFCRVSFVSFEWSFSDDPILGNDQNPFSTAVIIDDKGENHFVMPEDEAASVNFQEIAYKDKQHGYRMSSATVAVDGPVVIRIGNCAYGSGTLTITDSSGKTLTKIIDQNGNSISEIVQGKNADGTAIQTCFDAKTKSNYTTVNYEGEATLLTFKFTGTYYVPYFSVKDAKIPRITFKNRYPNLLLGTVPAEREVDEFTKEAYLPENYTLYREGWTVTGWTDNTTVYPLGTTAVFTQNTELYPVMQKNVKDITDTDQTLTVTWPFDHSNDNSPTPMICLHNKNTDPLQMTYTKQATVKYNVIENGTTIEKEIKIDVPLVLDATKGKVDNTDTRVNKLGNGESNSDPVPGGQINDGVRLIVPAVYGMKLTLHASDKVDTDSRYNNNTTCFGDRETDARIELWEGENKLTDAVGEITDNGKKITFTYTGEATQVALCVAKGGSSTAWGFFIDITAEYPVLPNVMTKNHIASQKLDDKELDDNAGSVVVNKQSSTGHANIGNRYRKDETVEITATPNYGYTVSGFKAIKADNTVKEYTQDEIQTVYETDANGTQTNVATEKRKVTYIVEEGITVVEVSYTRKDMHKVTVTAKKDGDKTLGEVTLSPKYDNFYREVRAADGKSIESIYSYYTEGTEVTAAAEAIAEYIVEKWTEGDSDESKSEENSYTVTTGTADLSITAHFKKGYPGTVVFLIDGEGCRKVNGPTPEYKGAGSISPSEYEGYKNCTSFTVPTNFTFYKNVDDDGNATTNGYTLTHWVDKAHPSNRYELGKTYSFKSAGTTLTLIPVFVYNPTTQESRLNNPVIRYDFGRKVSIYDDPTTGEQRKVSAQPVNIGSGKAFFWTSNVYIEALEDGKTLSHTRDVAMWVETGDKGFMRNTDIKEWTALGPGTKLWIASCAGTEIKIKTYSPIKTTTIDGKVPTEYTKVGENEYIYSYTTYNPSPRIAIEIGNDYSYYQWIEAHTLSANLVTLHNEIDDEVRGKVTHTSTTSEFDPQEKENGDYEFHKNDRVIINFERSFGFDFKRYVDLNRKPNGETIADPLTYEGERGFTILELLEVDWENKTGKVRMVNRNTSTHREVPLVEDTSEDGAGWLTTRELTEAEMNEQKLGTLPDTNREKNVFTLRLKEPTDDEEFEGRRTQYEIGFNITTNRNLQLQFAAKPTYYITFNAGQQATGAAPAAQWLEAGDQFIVPANRTLYYEGNTLKYWVDEKSTTQYVIGQKMTLNKNWGTAEAPDYNLRLFPVFETNTFSLLDITDEASATWNFATKDGAPTIAYERSGGILVTQLYKNAEKTDWIDLMIELDARSRYFKADGTESTADDETATEEHGKFNNTSNDDRMQVNSRSRIIYPATPGCKAKITATADISSTIVDGIKKGETGYTTGSGYIEVECQHKEGDEMSSTHVAEYTESNLWCIDFGVTYKPQTAKKPTLTALSIGEKQLTGDEISALKASGDKTYSMTLSPTDEYDVVMPEITGTADDGTTEGIVTVEPATIANPVATVTVKTKGGITVETYLVKFNFDQNTDTYPIFVSVTVNNQPPSTETTNEYFDAPSSGVVKVEFSRTMQAAKISENGHEKEFAAAQGKVLIFKYYDMPPGETIPFTITPDQGMFKDIYGKVCQQTLNLIMHIGAASVQNKHKEFDFVVGVDGTIDEAVEAANSSTADERFYIFVPDGEYQLTGNELLTNYKPTTDGVWPCDNDGNPRQDMEGKNNGMTRIIRHDVSVIGQSREGVMIWNKPVVEGIGYTATLHLTSAATDFYAEDLSLENRFDFWRSVNGQAKNNIKTSAGRGVVFWDQANRSIMKNVSMMSWQDTYYSANESADFRGYFENCEVGGAIDWLCGSGDIWLETCDITVRDRYGNNLAAPAQNPDQQWGYVFNNCRISLKEEDYAPGVNDDTRYRDNSWTLARPWNSGKGGKSPACTFLNTRMSISPRLGGWGTMSSDLVLRFHEYNTMDANGNRQSLGTRSLAACSPASGSDDCVLNETQASRYTIRETMGGNDAFNPQEHTQQINAISAAGFTSETDSRDIEWNDDIEIFEGKLQWKNVPDEEALCYFIFKKVQKSGKTVWQYVTNIRQEYGTETTSIRLEDSRLGNYGGTGIYCVRAANQRGGLGMATKEIECTPDHLESYTLTIKQVGETEGYGWSTICLPYNSRKPDTGVKVYAALAHRETGSATAEDKVNDYYLSLTEVSVLDANKGYVVYGPVGDNHTFTATTRESEHETILRGNTQPVSISATNINCYVLANKTYGLGFYKYAGSTLAAYKAWLPVEMVDTEVQNSTASGTKGIRFFFETGDTPTGLYDHIRADISTEGTLLYNLSGQPVTTPQRQGIYIRRGKGKVTIQRK